MDLEGLAAEMAGAELGDPRQVRSLVRIATALAQHTELSLTAACGPGLRQAAHRIFEHQETTVDRILGGHFAATAARCAAHPRVLIAQDTTSFSYRQAQITGLLALNDHERTRGLQGHAALALTLDGTPLGLLSLQLWGAEGRLERTPGDPPLPPEARESRKWLYGLEEVAARLPPDTEGVLIQDREGDYYTFLAAPRPANLHLLVRMAQDRRATAVSPAAAAGPEAEADPATRLCAQVAAGPLLGTVEVAVPRRAGAREAGEPAGRTATLEVRTRRVELRRPQGTAGCADTVEVWVVEALEREPPPDQDGIWWVLLATFPVETLADAAAALGYYALRWRQERLHYTLKSGLATEKLQIDDAVSLGHALAVYYVIAYRVLRAVYLARTAPDAPVTEILTVEEVAVLEAKQRGKVATVGAAVRAIAQLAGHEGYRSTPAPGVKRVWQGWRRLGGMLEGWRLARAELGALAVL